MGLLSFVFVACSFMTTAYIDGGIPDEMLTYRILYKWPSSGNMVRFDINVNRRLDETDFKELILRVVREQKLETYDTIRLYFYYDLDEYIPAVGSQRIGKKNYEHFLGSYTWSEFYASKEGGGTLRILKDKFGNNLPKPKNIVFNHLSP